MMNATIGLLLRITVDGTPLVEFRAASCAAYLAIRHLNEGDSSIVALGSLAGIAIHAISRDTRSNEVDGIRAYLSALSGGADVVIGAARSAVSIPVAQLDQSPI